MTKMLKLKKERRNEEEKLTSFIILEELILGEEDAERLTPDPEIVRASDRS